MEIPPNISAELAAARQNVTLSLIKSNAQAERKIATLLETAVRNVPASSLGGNINFTA
ncbi:MAG: hypothetical protein J0L77_09740 [Alphaproteobacteria bacterium]|nr:hypothetical protein [Alphaproteobacteria bacterium]